MLKLIKWGLLGVVAIALLIKVSLWLSVRSIMDDVSTTLAPLMELRYDGITSSFNGRVGLEGVEIRIPAIADRVQVAHAELVFSGLGELLSFKERLAEHKLPEQMSIRLEGLTLDLHGPIMQALYMPPGERSLASAMSEVRCGSVRHIGVSELQDMGYHTVESDVQFSYTFQPGAQTLNLNMTGETREMGAMRLGMLVMNMPERPHDLRANPPRLKRVSVEVTDNQYLRRMQNYCANKQGVEHEAYLQLALAQFDRVLRLQRVALNESVLQAYGRYLADPQSLRVELEPSEGMVWDGLQFFDAQDVLTMMRPTVLVNQTLVESLGFAWVDPLAAVQPAVAAQAAEGTQTSSTVQPAAERFVTVQSLPQHVGKRLRFVTFDGMYYQGVLTRIMNDKAYLSLQGGNGTAEMSLRLEKISQVRVQF
ncbi:MAG: hypothetical protein KJ884_06660 [Gammaproteobacteria bacterium]|nr:hypothetical protein [Gammaproteobacteria bacterium]MBU1489790.1 hypothetical protein [Gammaproteobacteria bacterium]MBU2067709.1 hypothetical protein [Gammaproteobacteria bacterium]MBU2138290.1 hypothetical protein [Gammaproteobacteria bacterium]MBU2218436.1 hypothetical protein [Gammaproteobacteria bacterium]